jgi:hypothetical protein
MRALGSGLLGLLIVLGALVRLEQIGQQKQESMPRATARAPQAPPQIVDFKKLVLDGAQLAGANTPVEVIGVYVGLGLLYGPNHTSTSVSDDSVRLLVAEDSSRGVREYLYGCRQRLDALLNAGRYDILGCPVRIVGKMTTCGLQINAAAEFPCLAVYEVYDAGSKR